MYAITLTNKDHVSFVFLGEVVGDKSFTTNQYRVMYWRENIGGQFVELGNATMVHPTMFSIKWTPPPHIQGGQVRVEPVVRTKARRQISTY